jgi:hypothetical protein
MAYKGAPGQRQIERDFPHIVETAIPPGGMGMLIDRMHDWHFSRGIESHHGRGRHKEGHDFIRWCFADAGTADAFISEFGGSAIERTPKTKATKRVRWGKQHKGEKR